jgi:spoIIIJ-associated protein
MIREFEGKTEKEAIEKAMQELDADRDSFDVEIVESQKGGLFKKRYVKIRIHTEDSLDSIEEPIPRSPTQAEPAAPDNEFEGKIAEFVTLTLQKMDCTGKINVERREKHKVVLAIDSPDSPIIIGKKGKTLDALQLLANLYAARMRHNDPKIILDCEKYRLHHEEALIRLAYSVASKVRSTGESVLLEPMNPYDRRLIHSTIGEADDIETQSEGDGLYKQIRVTYRGERN